MAFKIEIDQETFELDETNNIDAVEISDSKYHVLENNQSYQVEIIESDFASKKITVEVNGNNYEVAIKDEYDQLVKELGAINY